MDGRKVVDSEDGEILTGGVKLGLGVAERDFDIRQDNRQEIKQTSL